MVSGEAPSQVVPKLSQLVRRTYVPMINEGTLTSIVLSVARALAFCVHAVLQTWGTVTVAYTSHPDQRGTVYWCVPRLT